MKKEHEIIMLPTDRRSQLFEIDGNLIDTGEIQEKPENSIAVPQCLYILSNEKIKEGDACLCLDLKRVFYASGEVSREKYLNSKKNHSHN